MTWLRRCPLLAAASIVLAIGLFEVANASFMADDFIQLRILQGASPLSAASPFGLYAFFRPLSSGLLAADHAVAGLQPQWYRAQTLVLI